MSKKWLISIFSLTLVFVFASSSAASAAGGFHHPEHWDKNTMLYQGESGTEIKNLQYILNVMSFYTETGITDPDGIFGPKTRQAVMKYQEANGLVPDGIVGPKTWKSFSKFIEKKNGSTYGAGGYMGLRLEWKYDNNSDGSDSTAYVYGNGDTLSDKYRLYSR
ncbi:putative peptidoglycan binding protein [Scopulibacillus darangshiensis]|uniref:Putative peptidoglycan binding protein n=1 Tax=Scopulibacillus darangshiensis TaxID=442528 RepID=A0A4R2P3Y8_9BACL|nr:peptidoglycan-binding domain-containing protein [Scopulibacillus darangshiensis]TCP29432.1 putative peptidoglycan binding protein [Scopulibacillus darangshiensis]